MWRELVEVVRGWAYWFAFVTGGSFIRKARLKSVGKRVKISPTALFKFPHLITIGDDSFVNHLCSVWASENGPISIGNDVLLGPGVTIVSHNHGLAAGILIREQEGSSAGIVIGSDVWIGAHAVITSGVTIGDGCIVGAGAVVTQDLPKNSICVGVPARVLRFREPADVSPRDPQRPQQLKGALSWNR